MRKTRKPPGAACKYAQAKQSRDTMVIEQLFSTHFRCRRNQAREKATNELAGQSRLQTTMTSCLSLSAGDAAYRSHPAVPHSLLRRLMFQSRSILKTLTQRSSAMLRVVEQTPCFILEMLIQPAVLHSLLRRLKHKQAAVLHSLLHRLLFPSRSVLELSLIHI